MRAKIFTGMLVIFIFSIVMVNLGFADGMMIGYIPSRPSVPKPLPIKYHRVQVAIDNQVASTSIDQVFKNDSDTDLEGTYIFPLPETATITEFAMYMDGKKIIGEILDKDKARQEYEDIVRKMKDPALLEYVGRNMFKARVYPIPKHGEKRIELKYQETLKYDAGVCNYIYPLNTEKFSPVPLEEVAISVKIKSKIAIKSLYSPSHKIDAKIDGLNASCGYEEKNVTPDKDFVLYYTVSDQEMGLNLLCYRKPKENGYFLMLLSPGQLEGQAINKDIIFVLDTSGSMKGPKLWQAKEALRFCVNSLGKGDKFNVIGFATNIASYRNGLVDVDDKNIKGATEFIDRLSATGGTDIDSALLHALKMFTDVKKPRMVVFLTDGEPTTGVIEPESIIKDLSAANKAKARIFVFGVGMDVNSHLLDKIAEDERGISQYVLPNENIEITVSSFYKKISEPLISDINIDFGKIVTSDRYPIVLPDIFSGSQLVLLGRYDGDGPTAITLTGYVNGKEDKFVYEDTFLNEGTSNDFIPRIWATRKIGYLMSQIRLKGENRELVDEVVKLSKEYGIMTPYTSFLVLNKEADSSRWGIEKSMASNVMDRGASYKAGMEQSLGKNAIETSKDIIEMKATSTEEKPSLSTVKYVGDKTFYLKDKVWMDSEYKDEMKPREIKYLSEEYFELLKQRPGLGKYFAIGNKIIVVFEGECYKVIEE